MPFPATGGLLRQAALVRAERGEASGDPDDRTADFSAAGPAADPEFRAAFHGPDDLPFSDKTGA